MNGEPKGPMTKDEHVDAGLYEMAAYASRVQVILMRLRHLYEPRDALRWLTSGNALLANRVPADLLKTPDDAREVHALVERIFDGAFS